MTITRKRFCLLHSAFCLAAAASAATLEPNTRVSFDAVIPNGQNISLSLGRAKEAFSLSANANAYSWNYIGTKGEKPNYRPYPNSTRPFDLHSYWWQRRDYTPNGRYARSFSMPPQVAAASEAMMGERWLTADKRHLDVAVELSDGWLSFFVDGILFHSLPATADVPGLELNVAASKDVVVSEAKVSSVESTPGYWRVPLGRVATLPGNPLASEPVASAAPGTSLWPNTVRPSLASGDGSPLGGQIPFLAASNSVEVGRSWTREASVRDGGSPNKGAFGGRWSGALSATPSRLQFRVPNRRYEAMYLLASCASNNFLTVQFYRPGSGFPIDFAPAEPIATDGGLQLIRVPLRQDKLATFADRETLEFELTGHVENYCGHPEPLNYSRHGMGEPSGVVVHAITLKETPLEIDFDPESFGNIWVGSTTRPGYLLTLRNKGAADVDAAISVVTRSYDGTDVSEQARTLPVPARGEAKLRIGTPVKKLGWHSVTLKVNGETYERSLVVLRTREHNRRSFDDPGFFFGGWSPESGLHFTPPTLDSMKLASYLGLDSFSHGNVIQSSTDIREFARNAGMRDYTTINTKRLGFNPGRLKSSDETYLEEMMRASANVPTDTCDPSFQIVFAEPGGIGRDASIVGLCGGEVAPRTEAEQDRYIYYKTNFLNFAKVYRRLFPGKKLFLPWGSPLFTAAYLRDPDTRDQIDGMGYDTAFFDRLPEGQLHSCSLYVVTLLNREWAKYREGKPDYVTLEGPCISREAEEVLSPDEHLRNILRSNLILMANGVRRLFASISYGAECASYWGEQHYGGGALSRITLNPHRVYAAEGTLIRLLRGCEFVRVVPTGSLGTFLLEFRSIKDGSPLHVAWCINGRVPVTIPNGHVFDCMDNLVSPRFVTPDPIFIVGCKGEITFGKQVFDEAETTPAADAVKLCDLSGWTQVTNAPETEYLANMPDSICRYPVEMKVAREGDRLSVCLPEGLPDRDAMPFCTTLVPPKPVAIPGRPRVIALDVETDADWGRVVYVLRDAKGERFISVGRVNTYNVDDTRCKSFFTFSGRRLVRFELPGNRPWDKSRYAGSCWWGAYDGNDCVDYPLSLEKIYVERRTKAMYVNHVAEIAPKPVLFGALYVEGMDTGSAAEMPPPPAGLPLQNPIAEIDGTLPPAKITGVAPPTWQYDGTRGHFAFTEMPEAKEYDVYVSLSPTGEGAILLKTVKASGELVNGFLADTDNYAFVVWRDAKGAVSKPSAPFKFRLKDEFAEK